VLSVGVALPPLVPERITSRAARGQIRLMIHISMTDRLDFCNVVNTPEHSSTDKVKLSGKQKKKKKVSGFSPLFF